MIKVALKHFIFEVCIEQLFSNIINNFKLPSPKFKVGDKYSHISINTGSRWFNERFRYISYLDCEIIHVEDYGIDIISQQRLYYRLGIGSVTTPGYHRSISFIHSHHIIGHAKSS